MHLNSHPVHSDATISDALGLATPALDQELADDRRAALEAAAATFDPCGLYALEVERDETLAELAHNLPDTTPYSLTHFAQTFRACDQVHVRRWWMCWVGDGDGHEGETVTEAVAKALAAWRRRQPRRPDVAGTIRLPLPDAGGPVYPRPAA